MATEIEYEVSVTINTGNYQNIRPRVAVRDELRTGEHPLAGFRRVASLVDKLIEEKVDEIQADLARG